MQQLSAEVNLDGSQPVKLHGGNLLAVGTAQHLKSGVLLGSELVQPAVALEQLTGPAERCSCQLLCVAPLR